jgi:hypothetical protein
MNTETGNEPEQPMTLPGAGEMPDTLPGSMEKVVLLPKAVSASGGRAVQRSAIGEGVRMEKVVAVQEALLAGSYSVPAKAVAAKMLDAMLTMERERLPGDRRRKARVGHRGLIYGERRSSGT